MLKTLRTKMRVIIWIVVVIVSVVFVVSYGAGRKGYRSSAKPAGTTISRSDIFSESGKSVAGLLFGEEISMNEYSMAYWHEIGAGRMQYGEQFELMASRLDLVQQTWDRLALGKEAERRGIFITDTELARAVTSFPSFHTDGAFDPDLYRTLVKNRLKMRTTTFEDMLRESLATQKLMALVGSTAKISDREVHDAFLMQNEQVEAELIVFESGDFEDKVRVSEEDLEAYFQEHREDRALAYAERISVQYVLVDQRELEGDITLPEEELSIYYEDHLEDLYRHPAEAKVRHIFFRAAGGPPGEDPVEEEETPLQKAEKVLELAKDGKNFATLAKEHSEDTLTGKEGGLIDSFSTSNWGQEFDEAALALEKKGDFSSVVETPWGYHIIKLEDRKEPRTDSFDEVRDEILAALTSDEATVQALEQLEEFLAAMDSGAMWEQLAEKKGLTVHETGFFARHEDMPGISDSAPLVSEAFKLTAAGETSDSIETPTGCYLLRVAARQPQRAPETLDEVRDRVEQMARVEKMNEITRQQVEECKEAVDSGGSFEAAAKKFSGTFLHPEPFSRTGYVEDIGPAGDIARVLIRLSPGEVAPVQQLRGKTVIARLVKQIPADESDLQAQKPNIRVQLRRQKRMRLARKYKDQLMAGSGMVNYIQ